MIDSSAFQGKKAAYYTLGCKLNFSETSTFGKMLSEMGVVASEKGEKADICIINTCSVTEVADHKCRQAIHRMARENPGAFIVVTGCYAQLEAETVSKIDGVDLVLEVVDWFALFCWQLIDGRNYFFKLFDILLQVRQVAVHKVNGIIEFVGNTGHQAAK